MALQHIDIVFQLIAFLFAISVHEFWGGGLLARLISPAVGFFNGILLRI